MKKKRYLALFFGVILLVSPITSRAGGNYRVSKSNHKFAVMENPVDIRAYNINGSNYVTIETFANMNRMTTKREGNKLILDQIKDAGENPDGEILNLDGLAVGKSKDKLFYRSSETGIEMLNLSGRNLVKLQDLSEFFNLAIDFDSKTRTVNISSKEDEEAIYDPLADAEDKHLKDYGDQLKKVALPLDIANIDNNPRLGEIGLDKYQIYLIGEGHGTSGNDEISRFFIEYLNKKENVRKIIEESGYASSQLINEYLQTGNRELLDLVFKNLEGTFGYSQNSYDNYVKLYELNKNLPENKKIELLGIDVEHQVDTGIYYLNRLINKQGDIPEGLKADLDIISNYSEENFKIEKVDRLQERLKKDDQELKKFLAGDYESFKFGFNNIVQALDFFENDNFDLREEYIIENFKKLYDSKEKYFGIFGGAHTVLNKPEGDMPYVFASYLMHQFKPTKGRVASMTLFYNNSYTQYPGEDKPSKIPEIRLNKLLGEATESDYTIYPLEGKGSIFQADGSSKSQQYILLIKNSQAARPYKK